MCHRSTTLCHYVSSPFSGCFDKFCFFLGRANGLPGSVIRFSYSELEKATCRFSGDCLIGHGGSSNVYRGQLKNGRVVAVKLFRACISSNAELEFSNEMELSSRLNHCNIVPIIGYCLECRGKQLQRLLVYPYMSNGNLRDCLDVNENRPPLEWHTRMSIALGVARGLEYLHEGIFPQILHRDVKSANILLDEQWRARITDFGVGVQLGVHDSSAAHARVRGSFGYFAPECAVVGNMSPKSDVFSFGVVLLELISGRPPVGALNASQGSLVLWAAPRLLDMRLIMSDVADPVLKGKFSLEEIQCVCSLVRECLQLDPACRPSMAEVLRSLSTILSVISSKRALSMKMLHLPLDARSSSNVVSFVQMPFFGNVFGVADGRNQLGQEDEIYSGSTGRHFSATDNRLFPGCTLPFSLERTHIAQQEIQKICSFEHEQNCFSFTGKSGRWKSQDEEIIDLLEPTLEFFKLP